MKSIILRKIGGRLTPLWQSVGGPPYRGPSYAPSTSFFASTLGMLVMTICLVVAMWLLSHGSFDPHTLAIGGFGLAGTTANLKQKKEQLAGLLKELDVVQKKMAETGLTAAEGEAAEQKAVEAEKLQKEIDSAERIERLVADSKQADPILPEGKKRKDPSAEEKADNEVVGYIALGDLFVNSPEYLGFLDNGAPRGQSSAPMHAKKSVRERWVPITRKMRGQFEVAEREAKAKGMEQKAIPTLTGLIIQTDRISELVRTTEPQRLTLRDVLNVSRTDSNLVEYITVVTQPAAAAPTAENTAKPEATSSFALATAPVRTLAVWQPITEQQLADAPQLADIVNNDLIYDLARLEERQFLYGTGVGENLLGLFVSGGVPAITRTVTATTNIDRIRIGITDVMIAGYDPNAVVIHPIDWEAIVLAKGTDNRYIWALIDTGNGPRIWGIRVVETVSALKPAATERNFIVGDFIRGATVWDRQDASVQVGWVNDDFIKNRRTIRAEERLAFGIKRPTAFAKFNTAV